MSVQTPPATPALPWSDAATLSREARSELTTDLLRQALQADEEERRELRARVVLMHLKLAESVAWRYQGRGQDHQDLVQIARLGLVEAVERFDPDRGPFIAYATPTMIGHIKRHFRDHGWFVRPPRAIQEKQALISRAKDDLSHLLARQPTIVEIANHLGLTEQDVREAENIQGCFHPASLDVALGDSNGASGHGFAEVLGGEEPALENINVLATVSPACRQLPADDRRLLYLRFVAMCTQDEIAADFGISQMQVSRWLRRVLRELKATIGELEPPADSASAA